jgi:hypothetical protein
VPRRRFPDLAAWGGHDAEDLAVIAAAGLAVSGLAAEGLVAGRLAA